MGRPQKQTAEYFPHFTGHSRTIFILQEQWGNDGYAFWFKLLELLCERDGHYYEFNGTSNVMYLTSYMKVSQEMAEEILDALAEMGNIDKELWKSVRVIWCDGLLENLKALYAKRTIGAPEKPTVEEFSGQKVHDRGVSDTETAVTEAETPPEKPKPKRKTKAEKEAESRANKIQYAEFVYMTEEEHQKLLDKHGEQLTGRMIEILDNYKGSSNKTYANDYRAILNWVVERAYEEASRRGDYGNIGSQGGRSTAAKGSGFNPSSGFRNTREQSNTGGSQAAASEGQKRTTEDGKLQVVRSGTATGRAGDGWGSDNVETHATEMQMRESPGILEEVRRETGGGRGEAKTG